MWRAPGATSDWTWVQPWVFSVFRVLDWVVKMWRAPSASSPQQQATALETSCGILLGPLLLGFVIFFSSRKKLQNPNLRRGLFLLLVQLGSIIYWSMNNCSAAFRLLDWGVKKMSEDCLDNHWMKIVVSLDSSLLGFVFFPSRKSFKADLRRIFPPGAVKKDWSGCLILQGC
jgi:hypothetical protein